MRLLRETPMETMNSCSNVSHSIKKHCQVVTVSELTALIKEKKEGDVHILVTGDCHIAARSVDTKKITSDLDRFTSSEILQYTDSLVINGDLLDRRISLASDEASDFMVFALGLMARCKKHGVSLDVLEGTPSHDNRQPALLELLNQHLFDAGTYPIRYLDRVCVVDLLPNKQEYVQRHFKRTLNALFIPDEVSTDAQVTWGIVQETLALASQSMVDMAYLHGVFRYQEPAFTEKSHSEENYEGITRGRIIINHWHLSSAKGRIRAPGSPERLRHGEEETKGFYYTILSPGAVVSGVTSIEAKEYFVVNENATIFKTVDVSAMSLVDVHRYLDQVAETHPEARVRLQLSRLDEVYPNLSEIKARYRSLKITEKLIDSEVDSMIDLETINTDVAYAIRPDNLASLIAEKIEDKPEEIKSRIQEILGAENGA